MALVTCINLTILFNKNYKRTHTHMSRENFKTKYIIQTRFDFFTRFYFLIIIIYVSTHGLRHERRNSIIDFVFTNFVSFFFFLFLLLEFSLIYTAYSRLYIQRLGTLSYISLPSRDKRYTDSLSLPVRSESRDRASNPCPCLSTWSPVSG